MKVLATLSAALAAGLTVNAAPTIEKRGLSANDSNTLSLALYLEHLEFALYSGGFNAFDDAAYEADGFPPGYRENINVIAGHEMVHADTIAGILTANGVNPVPPCTYSFPYSTPMGFVALANMITTVGIGAYIGGSEFLIDDSDILTSAASILTIEARHDSYLRSGIGASLFPTNFDTSLTALWAYNLAQMFIVSCPMQLPIRILPKLSVAPMPPMNLQPPTPAGTVLTFTYNPTTFLVSVDPSTPLYIAFINQMTLLYFAPLTVTATGTGTVPLPENITGIAFAVLTTYSGGLSEADLSSMGTLAGPVEVALS